jgi:hypothetical protein
MSIRLILRLVAVGVVLIAVWLVVRPRADLLKNSVSSLTDQEADTSAAAKPTTETNPSPAMIAANPAAGTNGPTASPGETEHETYVSERVTRLQELAMEDDSASLEDDSASLEIILSELNNRDPEIREAARESAVQFGSRDAIPKLADAALQTDDAHEKAALADAMEFLKLPSLSEVEAQSGGQGTSAAIQKGTRTIRRKTVAQTPSPAPPQ